jgi:hypothetical protein
VGAPYPYNSISFQNHQNYLRIGDLANILETSPGKTHRELAKLAFGVLGDLFWAFSFGTNSRRLQMVSYFKIHHIFYGENAEVEYDNNTKDAYTPARDWKRKNINILM